MSKQAVRMYYEQYDEWARMDSASGQIEFMRSMGVLEQWLPEQARVLDIGGGPGRYAVELARRGHRVSLVDLCSHHIEMAREQVVDRRLSTRVERMCEGDACDLSMFGDDSFDAAMAFGPFYHLVDDNERRDAAAELARVTRPSGVVFVQFIPPLSGVVRLMERADELPQTVSVDSFQTAHAEYVYRNPSETGFQEAAYMTPEQAKLLFEQVGFVTEDLLSVLGLAAGREERLCRLQARDPELYEAMASVIEDTAREPAVIETGELAMWVGRLQG